MNKTESKVRQHFQVSDGQILGKNAARQQEIQQLKQASQEKDKQITELNQQLQELQKENQQLLNLNQQMSTNKQVSTRMLHLLYVVCMQQQFPYRHILHGNWGEPERVLH